MGSMISGCAHNFLLLLHEWVLEGKGEIADRIGNNHCAYLYLVQNYAIEQHT